MVDASNRQRCADLLLWRPTVLFQTVRPKSEGTLVIMGLVFIQSLELNIQMNHN